MSAFFQPAKKHQSSSHNFFKDILNMIKSILIVVNDFLKLNVLDSLIDFMDTLFEINQKTPNYI